MDIVTTAATRYLMAAACLLKSRHENPKAIFSTIGQYITAGAWQKMLLDGE
ncbi:MAG: hypothetical protein WCG92_16590 [Hyphomicrobiales bacterium]|nr:hypothetical protein [Alphaproteobacteria bacterium]